MPRKFIRRYLPDHHKVREHKYLRIFGQLLHDPNLWHLNRRSATGAFAVGLFFAFFPIPSQMVYAAAVAIWLRVNLPLSVALVWITNPLTIPPIFYFCYKVGTWLLGAPLHPVEFEFSVEWVKAELDVIWLPLLVGSLVVGTVAAAAGAGLIRLLWRLHLMQHIKERRRRRALREAQKRSEGPPDGTASRR